MYSFNRHSKVKKKSDLTHTGTEQQHRQTRNQNCVLDRLCVHIVLLSLSSRNHSIRYTIFKRLYKVHHFYPNFFGVLGKCTFILIHF